jgi:hypothetical protein
MNLVNVDSTRNAYFWACNERIWSFRRGDDDTKGECGSKTEAGKHKESQNRSGECRG